jgi:hypothetical protein
MLIYALMAQSIFGPGSAVLAVYPDRDSAARAAERRMALPDFNPRALPGLAISFGHMDKQDAERQLTITRENHEYWYRLGLE